MRSYLILGLLCAVVLVSGCIELPKIGQSGGNTSVIIKDQTGIAVNLPATAKGAFASGKSMLPSYITDGILVSVSGSCAADGSSMQWTYSFDAYSKKKNLRIVLGEESGLYDGSYSFMDGIGEDWIDSVDAARACGMQGDCYLESKDGKRIWTIVDGSRICQVDATDGKVLDDGGEVR